ncbi:MAG: diguanylate cyclase [Pseudomonadota bacterium]|nr:diguanylate cyclase [Pseudomonadota bacterium]
MLSFFKEIHLYLLSEKDDVNDSKEYRRLIFVKLALGIVSTILLAFSGLHAFILDNGHELVAIVDFLAALVTIYAIIDLKINQNIDRAALIGTSSLFIFFITFSYLNQNESFGLIWLIFFPVIAITINQTQRGLRFALVFLLAVSILGFLGIGEWQDGAWDLKSFLRLSIALSLVIFVMYVHEITMDKAQKQELDTLKFFEDFSLIDELTKIANRRRINELLDIEFKRSKRYQTTFAIVLFDIDHFKQVNDTYGHLIGDDVLKALAKLVSNSIRETEMIGRWGGEEFMLILTESDQNTAFAVAEKIRRIIAETEFDGLKEKLTCSFGIAEYKKGLVLEEMIAQADQALYQAKSHGRNQVIVHGKHR